MKNFLVAILMAMSFGAANAEPKAVVSFGQLPDDAIGNTNNVPNEPANRGTGIIGDVMVIDVSEGPEAESYPVSYYLNVDVGMFNCDTYKTTKIALRKVEPGSYWVGKYGIGKTEYSDGEDKTEAQKLANYSQNYLRRAFVRVLRPYYIQIFETTRQQYYQVMGGTKPDDKFKRLPYMAGSWDGYRGETVVETNVTASTADSFLSRLCRKCHDTDGRLSVGFDLPTYMQWEIAARAGMSDDVKEEFGYFVTNSWDEATQTQQKHIEKGEGWLAATGAEKKAGKSDGWQLNLYSNYSHYHKNSQDEPVGTTKNPIVVGSLAPNPWGIYDMMGNAAELARDYWEQMNNLPVETADADDPFPLSIYHKPEQLDRIVCYASYDVNHYLKNVDGTEKKSTEITWSKKNYRDTANNTFGLRFCFSGYPNSRIEKTIIWAIDPSNDQENDKWFVTFETVFKGDVVIGFDQWFKDMVNDKKIHLAVATDPAGLTTVEPLSITTNAFVRKDFKGKQNIGVIECKFDPDALLKFNRSRTHFQVVIED